MLFSQLLNQTRQQNTAAPANTAAPPASSRPANPDPSIENPRVKANATRSDVPRQPLGPVAGQPHGAIRPAEAAGNKPAKSARTDAAPAPVHVHHVPAPAQTHVPAPAQTRAAGPAPDQARVVAGPVPAQNRVVAVPPQAQTHVVAVPPQAQTRVAATRTETAPKASAPGPVVVAWTRHTVPNLVARRTEFASCFRDIDSADVSDPMFVSEYVEDVYDYLRKKEVEDQIIPNYMTIQTSVTPRMRMVLIDWIVEVQLKFRMTNESLYLSVNIVDKYLQKKVITREQLQLLGVTAMHIASKFEEVYSVDLNDFVFICDHSCTAADIINFESEVLRTIGWNLTTPCALHFLRRYSKAANSDGLKHTMAKYLTELSLGFYNMLKYLPSTQAAAAVLLTRHLLGATPYWPDPAKYHSCYQESEILECARDMLYLVLHPDSKFRLVTRKYSGAKFCNVARTAAENAPKVKL